MKPSDVAQIKEVKSRLREAHAREIRNALLVGRNSDSIFHDALNALNSLERELEDISLAFSGKVRIPRNAQKCDDFSCVRYRNINGGCDLCGAPCL